MTLCIAAHCDDFVGRKIVVCYDRQIGDELSTSDMAHKCIHGFSGHLVALLSGTMDQVEDALQIYKTRIGSKSLTLSDFKEELWVGFQEFQDALKRRGQRRKTDVQLIVAGFIERVPKIVTVDHSGVFEHPNFTCIGTGAYHADTLLRWRDTVLQAPLDMVLYFVYEAKKFGELSPYVGKSTIMEVLTLSRDGEVFTISLVTRLDVLESWFREFGPRDFAPAKGPPLMGGQEWSIPKT